jgi:hypothetical protein
VKLSIGRFLRDGRRKNAVDVEVAKSIAIAKTLPLKKTPKIEVVKQNNVEKPLVSELPKIALDGGTAVNKLMTFHVLRRLTEENVRELKLWFR